MNQARAPVRWTVAFCIALALACSAGGLIAGYLLRPQSGRYFVDEREIKVPGEIPVWSVRWVSDDGVKLLQIEGTDNKDQFLRNYLGVRR